MNIYEIITLVLLLTDFIFIFIIAGIPIFTKLYCLLKGVKFSEYDSLIYKYGGDKGVINSLRTCIKIMKSVRKKGDH